MQNSVTARDSAMPSRNILVVDGIIWALLGLLLIPVVITLQGLPWAQSVAAWVIPVALLVGLAIGIGMVVVRLPNKGWWVPLIIVPMLGLAATAGIFLTAHSIPAQDSALVGTSLLGAYVTMLGALLPWLVFRVKQMWLAVVLIWLTLAGATNNHLTPAQIWQLVWVLAISLILLGVFHLREEMSIWNTRRLEQIGPVLWPSARAIVSLSLLVAVLGLAPFSISRVSVLNQWWNHFSHSGNLTYDSPNSTPVAVLGSPLGLNSPDVSGNQTILLYSIIGGANQIPPLLGATLDSYDSTRSTWTLGNVTTMSFIASSAKTLGSDTTIQARITVKSLPEAKNGSLLLGFNQPLNFSVPTQVQVVGTRAADSVAISTWQSKDTLRPDTVYTTTSLVLPEDDPGVGTLPDAITQRMTVVPVSLKDQLQSMAQTLIGSATTPAAKAHALLSGLYDDGFVVDAKATPPKDVDPIKWFLENKRGNVLLWTTAYILLGRSIGLPLRLAEGYLPGSYDIKAKGYVVHGSDATVWAQLAVPGRGWLDFFPASTVATIIVPGTIIYATTTPAPTVSPSPQPTPSSVRGTNGASGSYGSTAPQRALLIIVSVLLFLLLTSTAIALFLGLRWSRFGQHLTPLSRLFARLGLLAKMGGVALQPSDTATQAIVKVAAIIPQHKQTLFNLNSAYERMRYSLSAERNSLTNLSEQWQRLRGALWQLVITRPWRKNLRGR